MLLKIDNKEITLKYTLRGYMIFEQVTNHSFNGVGMSDFVILFYSMLMASDKELTITFDDFIDYLDENPQLVQIQQNRLSYLQKKRQLNQKKLTQKTCNP